MCNNIGTNHTVNNKDATFLNSSAEDLQSGEEERAAFSLMKCSVIEVLGSHLGRPSCRMS